MTDIEQNEIIAEIEERVMSAVVKKFEARITQVESSNRNLGNNLKFLRDLVEESVHLTEQTSGIVVEHVTTLDKRLDSIGSIFSDKIKRQLEGNTNIKALLLAFDKQEAIKTEEDNQE
jgi:hypothetical protein